MTVPCTSCGEILDPGDDRCPYCGTLAPPAPGTSVFAHEVAEPRWSDEPTMVERPATGADDPLTIPIREPAPPERRPVADGGLPRPALAALAALAMVVVLALVASQLVGGGGGDDDLASEDAVTTTEAGGDRTEAGPTSTAEPTTTTTSTTTTSTTSTTSTSTTTTTTPPAPRPGSVPVLGESFRGGWVAQLSSVPTAAGTAAVESAWNQVRADAPDTVAARSDEWPSLAPGYWVLVEPGPFSSEDEVDAFCASVGRSGDGCLPRLLSDRR